MSKKSTILYVDKFGGKPAKALGALTIAIGKRLSVRLAVAHSEGWVNEVVVKQLPQAAGGGAPITFEVYLLDSCVPFHNSDNATTLYGSANYDAAAGLDPDFFRVVPKLSATPGSIAELLSQELGYPFLNSDQASQTVNENYLYLCVIPTNAPDQTKWQVVVTTSKSIY